MHAGAGFRRQALRMWILRGTAGIDHFAGIDKSPQLQGLCSEIGAGRRKCAMM